MPSPVTPSSWKAKLNSLTGAMCEKMANLFSTVNLKAAEHEYRYNEAGLPSDDLAADICEALQRIGCVGAGGGGTGVPNPNLSAPGKPIATDGAYSDHVNIQWPASVASGGAVLASYRIYRSLNTNTNPANAALIATITAPTLTYDDDTVTPGVFYNYWIRAVGSLGELSSYSQYDTGNSVVPLGDLDEVADLRTSYGMGQVSSAISLVWTPPALANRYDVYRGTTSGFEDATKIYSNVSPQSTTDLGTPDPIFYDNVGELLLLDTPPSNDQDYFYWVKAKGDSPPSESDESNSSLGRVLPPSIYNQTTEVLTYGSLSYVVPAGITKAWVVLVGSGGGGAGGGGVYGGGGGGGGGIVRFTLTVAEAEVLELTALSGVDTGNAPSETGGVDGEVIELYQDAVLVGVANFGTGGSYNPGGNGDGGEGGDAGAPGGTSPVVYNGTAGMPADGANGGRSGYSFGARRLPMADGSVGGGFTGDGNVGSGAKAVSFNPALSVGGSGNTGKAYITFGT